MSEGEQLLLVVSLVYLSGCLLWIDRRTVLFASWFGRRWKAVVADYSWGNSVGRAYLLNPFPPFGFVVVSRLLPVSLSPANIVSYNVQTVGNSGRPRQSRRLAPISPDTRFSRRGSALIVDGKTFCDIGDVPTAHSLVMLLNRIKHCDEASRGSAIAEFWKNRLDVRRTGKHLRKAMSSSRPARLACSFGFVLNFMAIPLSTIWIGVNLAVLLGAAAMICSALAVCWCYIACHRRHYPVLKQGIAGNLVKMVLCPPSAFRACDVIMERMTARLDALPVAVLLLRGAEREAFLSGYLADLKRPDIPDGLPDAIRETCLWQNKTILETLSPSIGKWQH